MNLSQTIFELTCAEKLLRDVLDLSQHVQGYEKGNIENAANAVGVIIRHLKVIQERAKP